MTALEQIKDQVAKEDGYDNWMDLIMKSSFSGLPFYYDEIAQRYATACIKASLEKAARNAENKWDDGFIIDKSSITNPDNIVLL